MPYCYSTSLWSPSPAKPIKFALIFTLSTCVSCGPVNDVEQQSRPTSNASLDSSDNFPIEQDLDASTELDDGSERDAKTPQTETVQEQSPAIEQAGAIINRREDGYIAAIDFGDVAITNEMTKALQQLKKITRLSVHKSALSNDGWQRIGELSQLTHLDLRDCNINNQQLTLAVAELQRLAALRLNGKSGATQIDDSGLRALENCPELRLLAVDFLPIGATSLGRLTPRRLHELYAAGTKLDDQAMNQLSGFTTLKALRLSNTEITDAALGALENLPLQELDVSECSRITDAGMQPLSQVTTLRKLNLFKTRVSDVGIVPLTSLSNLEWLNLDQTEITDMALNSVARLPSLKFLHLGSTAVSDAGMPELVDLNELEVLIVTRTQVSASGVDMVRNWLPDVEIQLEYVPGR